MVLSLNNLYAQRTWAIWHDCGRNTEVKLPKTRICQPKPCARRTHPKMGCVLRAHGFGWKIRDNGSWAPIFCRRASILSYNWVPVAYQTLVWENRKIDAKSIFRSLDQCHNFGINSGDGENWRGIDFCVHKHQRMVCCHILYINIILAAKYGVQIPKIAPKPCTYMCVLKHNIHLIWYGWILEWHFFLV